MTVESIIRRRAFRDGFYDGRQGCPMRRLATRKARWLYGPHLCQRRANQPAGLRTTSRYRGRSCRIQGDTGAIYGPSVAAAPGVSLMSAIGTKRTCRVALHMSAFRGKADII